MVGKLKLPDTAVCPEPQPRWLHIASASALGCAFLSGLLAVLMRSAFAPPGDEWYVHGLSAELPFVCERTGSAGCTAPWLNFAGHCYRWQPGPKAYEAARDACVTLGGQLVSLHSPSENAFVHALCDDGGDLPCIIGLRRAQESEEEWSWEDGSDVNFTKWASARQAGDSWETAALGDQDRVGTPMLVLAHCTNILFMALSYLSVVLAFRRNSSCYLQLSMITNGVFSASAICLGVLALLVISRDPVRSVPEFVFGFVQLAFMLCVLVTRVRLSADRRMPGAAATDKFRIDDDFYPGPQVISGPPPDHE